MMNTVHAVVTYSQLLINEQGKLRKVTLPCEPFRITDLYAVARGNGITHLWLMDDVDVDMDTPAEYSIFATYEDAEQQYPVFARIYKNGQYGEVKIGFDTERWGWHITAPVDILATIHYLEQVLGVPVEWSPGHMGTELVKHLNRTARREEWVRDSTVDLFQLPFKSASGGQGGDLKWKTGLEIEGQELYLHQFDKRSGYLSVCSDLYVGAGDPVEMEGLDALNRSLPGVYRVKLSASISDFDNEQLPMIIANEWVTLDVLKFAMNQGYSVQLYEAHVWEEKHKTLASYASKLWESRRIFREDYSRFPHQLARQNAENTMKEIALVATGKFASESKAGAFRQPYWWAAVVGKMRVAMLANIHKIYQNTGLSPALIYAYSVYYASTDSNPRTAVPGILDREDKLGGFRHDGTWRITPEIIEQFRCAKPGIIQKYLEHTEKEVAL